MTQVPYTARQTVTVTVGLWATHHQPVYLTTTLRTAKLLQIRDYRKGQHRECFCQLHLMISHGNRAASKQVVRLLELKRFW